MDNEIKQIIVASGPVIVENGRVLLNKHGEDKFWKFLGGRVELEDFSHPINFLEDACKREAKEENGIDIEIICPLKPMMVPKPNSEGVYVVLIHYLAKRLSEVKLGDDIDAFQDFDVEKVVNSEYTDEEFAPNVVPVLKSYLELRNKGLV